MWRKQNLGLSQALHDGENLLKQVTILPSRMFYVNRIPPNERRVEKFSGETTRRSELTQGEEWQSSVKKRQSQFEKPALEEFRWPQRQSTTYNRLLDSPLRCGTFSVWGTGPDYTRNRHMAGHYHAGGEELRCLYTCRNRTGVTETRATACKTYQKKTLVYNSPLTRICHSKQLPWTLRLPCYSRLFSHKIYTMTTLKLSACGLQRNHYLSGEIIPAHYFK
jgi:hypothetical protein